MGNQQPNLLIITERYWPVVGGIESGILYLSGLLRGDFKIKILTLQNRPGGLGLFRSTAGLRSFRPYQDPHDLSVLPLLPSLIGRILLLPILLRHFPFVRRFMPRWSFDRLYSFFKLVLSRRVSKLIRNADLAVCFSGGYLGRLTQEVCAGLKIPLVFFPSIHPGQWNDSPRTIKSYEKAQAVVTYVKSSQRVLCEMGNFQHHSHVIALPIPESPIPDPERFKRKHGIDGPSILFVGRREAYKGLDLLMESFKDLSESRSGTRLFVIGPGDPIKDPPQGCLDLGKVAEAEKNEAFAACDILCVPSVSESLGIVYLEAWRNRKPVVACRIPETESLIDHERNGILVPQKRRELTAALEKLLQEPETALRMGAEGYRKYEAEYSNAVIHRKMRDLFLKVMQRKQ